MKFRFFDEGNIGQQTEKQKKVETLKREEAEGLRRFYAEIATPEVLRGNFTRWQTHLAEHLEQKYPDEATLQTAIERTKKYTDQLPIRHGASYEGLRASGLPHLASEFMVRGLDYYKDGVGNTNSFDRDYELDHFVYGFLGASGTTRRTGWDTQVYIRNDVLQEPGTVVALEDFGQTIQRLTPQGYKGNYTSAGPEEAFEVHLQQLWNGSDFTILLPMMLAYAYDRVEDFDNQKPWPLDLVPAGLPRLIRYHKERYWETEPDFPEFEVRIPQSVIPSDVIAYFVDESAIGEEPSEKSAVVVPEGLSPEERREFIKERLARLQNVPTI